MSQGPVDIESKSSLEYVCDDIRDYQSWAGQ